MSLVSEMSSSRSDLPISDDKYWKTWMRHPSTVLGRASTARSARWKRDILSHLSELELDIANVLGDDTYGHTG